MPNFNIKQEYMCVPIDFVKNLVPKSNPTFVKVYLYALMLAADGEVVSSEVIASKLELLESDVLQAMKYWEECGALGAEKELAKSDVKVQMIETEVKNNEALKEMLQIAQEVLGKTISTTDAKTLYWIYENLKMPTEVILMLLEYCVSINKRAMSYIEQTAIAWNERGINTMEQADTYLREQAKRSEKFNNLKRIFSINSREFTSIELEYLNKWSDKDMSEEMIALAYEYCILQINKLSFKYMDGIIENWVKKGIKTIIEAEAENEQFKNEKKSIEDFDILKKQDTAEEFEKIMWEKMNNED